MFFTAHSQVLKMELFLVLIFVNRKIHFVLLKEIKDTEGRMIRVQALIEGMQVILCNIYAPNKGNRHFFHEVNRV